MIRGLLQADESVIVNQDNCAQLFAHEATRVFHDRLVDNADRAVFYQMLSDNLHDYFKVGDVVGTKLGTRGTTVLPPRVILGDCQ